MILHLCSLKNLLSDVFNISNQDYHQKISFLHKTIREEKERLGEVFHKRRTFKRNFLEIFEALNQKNYASASQGYFALANKQLQRRDYDATSVLVLLGTLCVLNSDANLGQTYEYFEGRFLQSTFSIKLLKLLLQARSDGLERVYQTLWSMMKVIPVFDEEKILIQNVVSM